MPLDRLYPAKLLLFGEHTVLHGGRALAVPHPKLGVRWVQGTKPDDRLIDFARFLVESIPIPYFDHDRLHNDLQAGWQLSGNVPQGYGLGSSGTVCAAVYDRYATKRQSNDLVGLRHFLAKMEGHFHGQSSGTDPLVSYLNHPVLIREEIVTTVELPPRWKCHLFLLDTGLSRDAAPLIARFARYFASHADWRSSITDSWIPTVERAVEALLQDDQTDFRSAFRSLSRQQLESTPWLIPNALRNAWLGEDHALKICGAGGGGYLIGYAENLAAARIKLANWTLHTL